MNRFRNIHKGQRAFILCNGLSLNDVDVTKLNGEIVFLLNRGYILEKRGLDISNTYLVLIDELIIDQFKSEIESVKVKAKFCNRIRNGIRMHWTGNVPKFTKDTTKPMWQGHSVTNVALQLAYFMGCTPVYVLGMDHYISYKEHEKDGKNWVVGEEDVNHFDPNYLPTGFKFHGQSLPMVEKGYALASKAYWESGRELYNASSFTALSKEIMPRTNFEEIIGER